MDKKSFPEGDRYVFTYDQIDHFVDSKDCYLDTSSKQIVCKKVYESGRKFIITINAKYEDCSLSDSSISKVDLYQRHGNVYKDENKLFDNSEMDDKTLKQFKIKLDNGNTVKAYFISKDIQVDTKPLLIY